MSAARWAQQELLQQHPRADLRVYAVWFNMYPGDARAKWPAAALTDPRVRHRWDETRALGRQYLASVPAIMDRRAAETLPPTADAMWDAFFLYAPGESWQDPLPLPVAWGYPIMVTRDHLARQLDALVAR